MSWYTAAAQAQFSADEAQAPRSVLAMFWDSRARDFYFQEIEVVGDADYQGSVSRNRIIEVLVNAYTGKVTVRTKGYKYIDFDARLPKNKSLLEALKIVAQDWQVVEALSIAGNLLLEMPKSAIHA